MGDLKIPKSQPNHAVIHSKVKSLEILINQKTFHNNNINTENYMYRMLTTPIMYYPPQSYTLSTILPFSDDSDILVKDLEKTEQQLLMNGYINF